MENNFRVEVKNFGAVKDGIFDMKSLTIFIGDNDSGKSFVSKFIYIATKYLTNSSSFNGVSINNKIDIEKYKKTTVYSILNDFVTDISNEDCIANSEHKLSFNLDEKFIKTFLLDVEDIFSRFLKKCFEVYFTENLNDLININENEAVLKIYTKYIDIIITLNRNEEFNLKLDYKEKLNYFINLTSKFTERNEGTSYSLSFSNDNVNGDLSVSVVNPISSENLFNNVINWYLFCIDHLLHLPRNIDYFPANKSGILANYNTKFQNNVTNATEYIYNDKNLNRDNYIINDFIKIIQSFSNQKINQDIKLTNAYSYIQQEIEGKLYFNDSKMLQYKIGNETKTLDIPMESTSTKVTELTPIILYLENLETKSMKSIGTFLIIEEPESHLNPKMQRMMARLLVMMMNEGIQILITTHSDYILNEMDILLKLNHIKEKDEKTFDTFIDKDKDYESLMALDKENLSVYRFKKEGLDTEIEDIKITKNKVIEKEFEETSENLYLENSKVIEILKSI